MSDYIIANGQTISNQAFGYGDTILVEKGGMLSDVVIPRNVASVTLENGAILSGSIMTSKEMTINGTVNALEADLTLDISGRKPEQDILISNMSSLFASSLSVAVSLNQDKGVYRLVGNAADFSGTITITNPFGTVLGSLSLENPETDYDITRYTLLLNAANELCLTVSSSITNANERVLLYKRGNKVQASLSVQGVTLSDQDNDYQSMTVLPGGTASDITLKSNGKLAIYYTGVVENITQENKGHLDLKLCGDDGTYITGTNYRYGDFSYINGVATNFVIYENGSLEAENGTVIDGLRAYYGSHISICDSELKGTFYFRTEGGFRDPYVIRNSAIHDALLQFGASGQGQMNIDGGTIDGSTVTMHWNDKLNITNTVITNSLFSITGPLYFENATIGNTIFTWTALSGGLWGNVQLNGDLILQRDLDSLFVDARGNTVILDYAHSSRKMLPSVSQYTVSEDASFLALFSQTQMPGKYLIGYGSDTFFDSISISVNSSNPHSIIGTLTAKNQSFKKDYWQYSISYSQEEDEEAVYVTIELDPDYLDLEYRTWLFSDTNCVHQAKIQDMVLGSTATYQQAAVMKYGKADGITLKAGGLLKVYSGGDVRNITQENNGHLDLTLNGDDGTCITGTNYYFGDFSYINGVATNFVIYEEGSFEAGNGTVIDGLRAYYGSSISIRDSEMKGTFNFRTEGGFRDPYVIRNSAIHDASIQFGASGQGQMNIDGGTIDGSTVSMHWNDSLYLTDTVITNSVFSISGGMGFNNVTIGNTLFTWTDPSENMFGSVRLNGDLILRRNLSGLTVDTNGHSIILDYANQSTGSNPVVSLDYCPEQTSFIVLFSKDQAPDKFRIARNAGTFIDTFQISVNPSDPHTTIGSLSASNTSIAYEAWEYTISHDVETQDIFITVDLNSDYTGKLYSTWLFSDTFGSYHRSKLQDEVLGSTVTFQQAAILRSGTADKITLQDGGLLKVYSGGEVRNLTQENNGYLNLTLNGGDGTYITGTNYRYGDFSCIDGVATNFVIYDKGSFETGNGMVIDGLRTYYGSHISICDSELKGTFYFRTEGGFRDPYVIRNSAIHDATIQFGGNGQGRLNIEGGTIDGSTVSMHWNDSLYLTDTVITNSLLTMSGAVYFENATIGNTVFTWTDPSDSLHGNAKLNGDLILRRSSGYVALDGKGRNIVLDCSSQNQDFFFLTDATTIHNANLIARVSSDTMIGRYQLARNASLIGQIDEEGIYNGETNQWDYIGDVIGDNDGIIEVRNEKGILLASCTVNGETEYFGRYNYTVRVDDEGDMYLEIGWNTREGRTYAADGFDNHTIETALDIQEAGTVLTIDSETDVDWFKFTLDTAGRSSSYIGIKFKQWAGDLDLYLYDAAGNLLDYAKSVTDNELISLKGFAAGDYCIRVEGYEGNLNEYRLMYSLPEPVALTDEYELGNSLSLNTYLGEIAGTKTVHAAIQTADDADFFSFILPHKGTTADSLTLTFDPEFGDLELYLYDINGNFLLGKSISADSGMETLSFAGLKYGPYVAKVVSKEGILSLANYDLTFNVREEEVKPDKYESNDSMKGATNLYALNGNQTLAGLSIHDETDVDYYKFSILEKGSADDWITLSYEVSLGDLDLEILNANGDVVAYSRTAENEDTVSLKGLKVGDYYIRVTGCNNVANYYTLNYNVTNSSLIPADSYEGLEPITIREDQTITGLSIAKKVKSDETRPDTFKIVLEYDAWKRSKIILTDYRSDWEDGMAYVIKDANGNVMDGYEGTGSEISLYGLTKGEYYLTVDNPTIYEYSEYSLIAQCLPDSDNPRDNTWSFFIYMAGDNNLESAFLQELLYMQKAILPENVEVYVLFDRTEGENHTSYQRGWTDTRVGKIRHSKGGGIAVEWMYFDGVNTSVYMNSDNLDLKQEWNTGDVKTLEAFLDWGMQIGRADNYALIMMDHGSSLGYNCKDDTSDSIMNIEEIADLLRADKYDKLSVVAFDQCLMGSDVVISTMEGTVDYVAASEAVGWTPNLQVMYKVLLNSLETEMTPREVSQKIVAACNCSGLYDLTMASFNTADHTLSDALQAFGEAAKGFTREDWVAVCKSFALAHNYGDGAWAYSDLGFFLSTLKECTVSGTLLNAADTLYHVVLDQLVDSTMITPASYGSGIAVFNPVLSDDMISFYATGIGQTDWGKFLYTAGQLAEDCVEYYVDTRTNLTFTDFYYSFEDGAIQVTYDLGTFTGNGVEYNGLYMDRETHFTISLDKAGIAGDEIRVIADDPDANITISLIETFPTIPPRRVVRRFSTDGVLSLEGFDPEKVGIYQAYDLIISSDRETTYSLSFAADWSSGSDHFDYSRSRCLGGQGNGSVEKATKLAAGNYGGLVTYAGDPDFYQLNTVYSDTLNVTVNGSGLTVQEYDADGLLVQSAEYTDDKYTITVASGNYLRVEGDGDLSANQVNSYSLFIRDAQSTALSLGGTEISLPEKPDVSGELKNNQVFVNVNVENGLKGYQSGDLQNWSPCEDDSFVATDNGVFYFKAVDPETGLESKYVSLQVSDIDNELPTVSSVAADVTKPTNTDVVVTAEFTDNVAVDKALYRIGEDGEWTIYLDGGVTVSENATVYFKAVDLVGNESEIVNCEIKNIDKDSPVITLTGDNATPLQTSSLTAESDDGSSIFYTVNNVIWTKYKTPIFVNSNCTYYFKATDAVGNTGTASITFSNIDTTAPVITLTGDNATPLQASTLTAATEDGLDLFYSTDNEIWTKYEGTIDVPANVTYYFKATDAAGNVGTAEFTFGNIDSSAPVIELSGDNATPLQASTLTAATEEGLDIFVSMDNEVWTKYEGTIDVSENATYYFKATDAAGNTGRVSITFANIDTTSPVITLTGDNATPLQASTLTAATEDGLDLFYSTDNEVWSKYEGTIDVSANATYHFKATDAAGNVGTAEFTFGNIDSSAPVIILTGDNVTPLQASTLTAATEEGLDIFVSMDNENWTKYEGTIDVSENVTCYFKATDAAGNTGTNFIVFDNIDTTAPVITLVGDTVTPLQASHLTATTEVGLDIFVSTDNENWTKYEGTIDVSENATYYFKATDAAGNTGTAGITFANIDTAAPVITLAGDTVTPLQASTLTAATEDGLDLFYSTGNEIWTKYEGTIDVSANATYYFKATDAAGNVGTAEFTFGNIDSSAPVITLVGDTVTPLQVSPLTATTEVGLDIFVSTDNENWTKYEGTIDVSANATYYFKATDAAGNTGTNFIVFDNIDTTAPVITLAGDNATPLQTSSLTAATEDGLDLFYSTDNEVWTKYEGTIDVPANATYFFKATDVAGNTGTNSINFENIDRNPPEAPTASARKDMTSGSILVTAVFSDDSVGKEYSLDNENWLAYTAAISLAENEIIFFRGTDAAGNASQITALCTPVNVPDDNQDDFLYKNGKWNDANIKVMNTVSGIGEISLDESGTIDDHDMHNMFGCDGTHKDAGDVARIKVEETAKLTFTIDSTADGTFYVYQDGIDKKGKRTQITVAKVSVKANSSATLSTCLTDSDTYYVAMSAKSVRKGSVGLYNVNVTGYSVFEDADKDANNTALSSPAVEVGRSTTAIVLDSNEMTGSTEFTNFVGFSDSIDYAKLDLTSSTYLSFDLKANGAAKFTIWKQDAKGKLTKAGAVTTLNAKNKFTATTKAQFLDTSKYTYYISMESSDAAKGGSAYYNVELNGKTLFFDSADTDANDVLYDKKAKAFKSDANFITTELAAGLQDVLLDSNAIGNEAYSNFVGYGDSVDYAKIVLTSSGNLSFSLTATGDATFAIYRKGTDKKGKATLETIQTTKLTLAKGANIVNATTNLLSGLATGDYYISMTAKNTKANDKGCTFYNVTATFTASASASSSLAMPETSDALAMTDALSFGGYDADVLADASASALADLDDKSAWQNSLLA